MFLELLFAHEVDDKKLMCRFTNFVRHDALDPASPS